MSSSKYLPSSILIKLKATHFNFVNKNAVRYTDKAVKDGVSTWVSPYQKPQLVGHDKQSDPIGRIVEYQVVHSDSKQEPQDYVELVAKITDSSAIEKIMDGRYNTVSVGSKSSRVICSECNQNIIEDGLCEHKKGANNSKGKRIHWIIDQLDYVECSFVNEPADEYAGIDQINIGNGFLPYKDFLDNRETLISAFMMEDKQKMDDAKLSYASRQKLPDSAFCYVVGSGESKVRKFPAHDAAHVRNGLARLPQAKLPDSAKSKILGCLKRRAKRYGIKVGTDFVSQDALDYINSIDQTSGLTDNWTEEEIKAVEQLFAEDPAFDDLPEDKNDAVQPTTPQEENQDFDKMKKDELLEALKKLQEDSKKAQENNASEIKTLKDKVSELETILTEREDEVNRYLDQNASLEQRLRDAIIENIIDLKKPDNKDEREPLKKKLVGRSIESLLDTLSDSRQIEIQSKGSVESNDKIQDPTQTQPKVGSATEDEKTKDPWAVFSKDNRIVEVE